MSDYTDLITSEHSGRPKYVATVATSTDPFAEMIAALKSMALDFDLDNAVGGQLDIIGEWVGRSRAITTPIVGVYFAWDTDGVGWDQGYWRGPFDPTEGLTSLPDEPYRTLLRATVALNHWDGTVPSARDVLATAFPNNLIAIEDHQNMTMTIVVAGAPLDAVTAALMTGGYLSLRPACIGIDYAFTSLPPAPVFAWDADGPYFGGWDTGAWAVSTPPV